MAFISELIGRPVIDPDGKKVGTLKDLVARPLLKLPHPVIEALIVQSKDDCRAIPYSAAAALVPPAIPLKAHSENIHPYIPGEEDIYLARDVLDKQIIDTEGARVVRVNDLELVRANGSLLVGNVDVGGLGILRRAGLAEVVGRIANRIHVRVPQSYIAWDNMELLRYDQSMRLKVPREKLAELHPADIAEILSDLDRLESGQLLESLPVEQLADTLEEVEPEFQASLVERMPDERVADVLEEMGPDEAADLLAELPMDRSADILALMQAEEAEDVRKLLAYPEDSAGGIMTTEFISIRPPMTAEEAIHYLREIGPDAETIFYIYVTGETGELLGVISLSSLIFAKPDCPVTEIMVKRVVSIDLLTEQEEIAQIIAKYNLLAVPVVDEEGHLHGIVTADDALDKIIPTAWKKRLPRFYH